MFQGYIKKQIREVTKKEVNENKKKIVQFQRDKNVSMIKRDINETKYNLKSALNEAKKNPE